MKNWETKPSLYCTHPLLPDLTQNGKVTKPKKWSDYSKMWQIYKDSCIRGRDDLHNYGLFILDTTLDICDLHLINDGLSFADGKGTLQFEGTGPNGLEGMQNDGFECSVLSVADDLSATLVGPEVCKCHYYCHHFHCSTLLDNGL